MLQKIKVLFYSGDECGKQCSMAISVVNRRSVFHRHYSQVQSASIWLVA